MIIIYMNNPEYNLPITKSFEIKRGKKGIQVRMQKIESRARTKKNGFLIDYIVDEVFPKSPIT